MKAIITIAIIALVVALTATHQGEGFAFVKVAVDRVSAARTSRRGGARRNMSTDRRRRDDNRDRKPAPRPRRDVSVVGIVRSVAHQSKRARNAMEMALRDVGQGMQSEFAVVTVDTQEHGRLALVYRRSAAEWGRVRRFFQVGHPATAGSRVNIFGAIKLPTAAPVELALDVAGVIMTPDAVTFYERAASGEASAYFNQVVDGRERHERAVVTRVTKQGYCMRCRETVDRENVQEVVFQNGRDASRGNCARCGTPVFRTGEGGTEVLTRLLAEATRGVAA